MKKFFLIPLMTLVCSVMAFAGIVDYTLGPVVGPDGTIFEAQAPAKIRTATKDVANVAKIGETEYATLHEAFAAAENGDVVELLADCSPSTWYSGELDNTSITLKGNGHTITKPLIFANETSSPMVVTLDGVTVSNNTWYAYIIGEVTFELANGTTNAFTSSNGYGFLGYGNAGFLTIQGNGTLTVPAIYAFYQFGGVQIDAPNASFSNTSGSLWLQSNNIVLNAGSYGSNPSLYVDFSSHLITKPSTLYVVAAPAADVVAYNRSKLLTYTSLADAVADAAAGQEIYMYKNDAAAVSVSKNLTIHTQGFSNNLSAGDGYSKAMVGQDAFFTDNALAAFLLADGTDSYVVSANADISTAGAIHVHGTKTLTINEGVTVTYKRQGDYANIVVDEGAKLTVLGSGTFTPVMHSETRTIEGFTAEISTSASNQIGNRVIDVDGELVVGVKNDAANCPHFITSSIARGSAVMVNETGVATFNNADMHVASMSIKNYGNVTIHGGEYVSIATSRNQINNGWFAYHLNNEGIMTVNGGHFVGVQGAFSNATANAIVTINGGSFETVYGHNWATGEANTGANKDNFYALYVACYSVVNVYGGSYKVQTPSLGGDVVVLVGNNDAYNTYGIVNLYGGNFQQKVKIQARKNAQSSYPVSIPSTSQWYGCFGSEAPLPAGYEYYATGDATYPWGVRAIAGKDADAIDPAQQAAQEADPEYTIPWQQATTWASDAVPEENTIVTIPVDATVTVSNAEANKDAVADQVFVAQGATLKVEEGTTLTIGNGGMNIGNGGQIVVEAGATVKIGSAGVITTEEEALVIESNDDVQGVLLYDPAVDENTQPKATVKLTTKAKQIGANSYVFERFAIPTVDGKATTYSIEGGIPTSGLYNDAPSFLQAVWGWDNDAMDWYQLEKFKDMEPFKGYQLTNNSANGNLVYVFEGNLVGNQNMDFNFVENGFHFFGNSYSADINIRSFLSSLPDEVEKTVWVYDPYAKTYKALTYLTANGRVKYGNGEPIKDIRSMQAFLMNLQDGTSGAAQVDYASAIWGNPKYNAAPARHTASNEDWATIRVASANGLNDEVVLVQGEDFTSEFENGADARKFMNNENINLYATTNDGDLSIVATNDLNNTVLTFAASNASEYTLQFADIEGYEFTLRDNVTGATVLMTEGATYTFNQEANTTVPARFEVLGAPKVITAIDNVEDAAKKMGIYSITGQFLGHDFTNLPAGVYVVNGVKIVK